MIKDLRTLPLENMKELLCVFGFDEHVKESFIRTADNGDVEFHWYDRIRISKDNITFLPDFGVPYTIIDAKMYEKWRKVFKILVNREDKLERICQDTK